MFTVVITEKGGAQRRMAFTKTEVTIGRVQGNDVILPKGNVSKRHSRIVLKDNRFIVVDLKSTNGTYVNGRKITSPLVVKAGDKIYIGDFILTIEESAEAEFAAPAPEPAPAPPAPALDPGPKLTQQAPPPRAAVAPAEPPAQRSRSSAPPPLPRRDSRPPVAPAEERFAAEEPPPPAPAPAAPPISARPQVTAPAPSGGPLEPSGGPADLRAVHQPLPKRPRMTQPGGGVLAGESRGAAEPPNESVLRSVLARVSRDFDVTLTDPAALHDQERWEHAQRAVDRAIGQLQREGQLGGADPGGLAEAAVREAVGLGPLEHFFADESVRELVVEGPQRMVADLGRGLEPVPGSFSSSDALAVVARRLLAQAGEEMESGRMVYEAALPYGPYVTVVLPPIAIRGPIIEVRRMARGLSVDVLTERGMMSPEMAGVLREAIASRRNVLVTGTVGSGVTTVLGALATLSDDHERLVTVEEVPDLAIERNHVLSFGTAGGAGGLGLRQVVAQASRLRADRLVVDDIRGAEAFDVFTELASRQPGNLMGVHCGSALGDPGQGGLAEVQSLMKLAGPNDDAALSQLIARVVHVVVEVGYDDQGARRIQRVAEVVGANGTSVLTEELFYWDGDFVRGS